MSKKIKIALSAVLVGVFLVACGASQEKIDETKQALENMTAAMEAVEAKYLDITDSSRRRELDILAKEAEELKSIEIEKLSEKRIDALLSQIKDLTASYQSINEQFTAILNEETLNREEMAKHKYYDVYVVNKTGKDFAHVNFVDDATDMHLVLVEDDSLFKDGYTLMGGIIDVYEDSERWSFNCIEENGTEYFFHCDDIKGRDLDGATITLTIEADSGDPIATVSK